MSVATLPNYKSFFKPTLVALKDLGGSGNIDELNEKLIAGAELNEEQLGQTYPGSGALIILDRLSWARSYLKIAGYITNEKKGVWVLTDKGRTKTNWSVEQIEKDVAKAAKQAALDRQKAAGVDISEGSGTGESGISWIDSLLETISTIKPDAFERLCQRLLRESGFTRVEVTGKSGDGGIDGVGVLRVQLVSFHVLFQCKRWKGSVGSETVRNFRGAMQGRADKGLVITTGTFTAEARKEATRDGAPAIDLIDGEALCLLLKDLHLGVSVKEIRTEEISITESFFQSI